MSQHSSHVVRNSPTFRSFGLGAIVVREEEGAISYHTMTATPLPALGAYFGLGLIASFINSPARVAAAIMNLSKWHVRRTRPACAEPAHGF
jgi:hypothetical protein